MKSFIFVLTFLFVTCLTNTAFANGPWQRFFQDVKVPTQAMMEHDSWAAPASASNTFIKSGAAISNTAATTISVFSAQPDFARNITLTPTGTTANVGAGTAVVSGLNIFGKAISENFTISASQSSTSTGNKAFKSVSSVVFPQAASTGVTLSIGVGSKLGLRRCMAQAGDYDWSVFGGTYDATRGTIANSATVIESNTFTDNSSLNGASNVDVYYVQNYRCWPGQ